MSVPRVAAGGCGPGTTSAAAVQTQSACSNACLHYLVKKTKGQHVKALSVYKYLYKEGAMAKSTWKTMTEEQRVAHREGEKIRRARRKALMTPEQLDEYRAKHNAATKSAMDKRPDHYATVAAEYKRNGKGYYYSWANSLKQRAAERGVPYDIDAEYLMSIQTTHCPALGIAFERRNGRGSNSPASPTIDRIVPELGYVRGNVIMLSRRANNIKSDGNVDEIAQVLEWLRKV